MSTNSIFGADFKRGEVKKDINLLPVGRHIVIVHGYRELTDLDTDLSGHMKDDEDRPEWVDPTPQIAVTLKGYDPETGKITGVITDRFQGTGFVRHSELEAMGLNPDDYFASGPELYAVSEETRERVPSQLRTERAANIFNAFLEACGVEIGHHYSEMIGKILSVEVYEKAYEGKTNKRFKNPKASSVEVPLELLTK